MVLQDLSHAGSIYNDGAQLCHGTPGRNGAEVITTRVPNTKGQLGCQSCQNEPAAQATR